MFEGGYREPTIMRWKGRIPAGTKCDEMCSTIDVLPTVARLIGADLPARKIDGKDIRSLMFGEQGARSPHDAFYCYFAGGQLQAVRNQRFKLVFPHTFLTLGGNPGGSGGQSAKYQRGENGLSLFDLENDVSEVKNVISEHPQVVKELSAVAERAREDLGDRLTNRKGNGNRPPGSLTAEDERLPMVWK